jgi:hypothetical protein
MTAGQNPDADHEAGVSKGCTRGYRPDGLKLAIKDCDPNSSDSRAAVFEFLTDPLAR